MSRNLARCERVDSSRTAFLPSATHSPQPLASASPMPSGEVWALMVTSGVLGFLRRSAGGGRALGLRLRPGQSVGVERLLGPRWWSACFLGSLRLPSSGSMPTWRVINRADVGLLTLRTYRAPSSAPRRGCAKSVLGFEQSPKRHQSARTPGTNRDALRSHPA